MHPSSLAKHISGKFITVCFFVFTIALTTTFVLHNPSNGLAQSLSPIADGGTVYLPLVAVGNTAAVPNPTETPPTGSPSPSSTPTSTVIAPPSQSQPVGQSGNWRLVFADEFNAASLDQNTWRTCFWWADTTCTIESNNELELYNPGDVLVENGLLRLRAQQRDRIAWNGNTYTTPLGWL